MPLKRLIVAVGSTNPIKVEPVCAVLARVFPEAAVLSVNASSGVPAQPIGLAQIRHGAQNRAANALSALHALQAVSEAEMHWGVGLEGGVDFEEELAWLTGAVAVLAHTGRSSLAWSPRCALPPRVVAALHAGDELGPIMDELTGVPDSKTQQGAFGYFTNGLLPRDLSWEMAFACALAPFLRPELYFE